MQFKIKQVKNWKGENITSKINEWDVQKHEIKCTFQTNTKDFSHISHQELYRFNSFEDYFKYSITFSNEFFTDSIHTNHTNCKTIKKVKAHAWLCQNFPLQLKYFMPLLSMLTTVSKKAQKLKEFFEASSILNNTGFPVKAIIPILLTIKATLNFEEVNLGPLSPDLFSIPFEPNLPFSDHEDRLSDYVPSMIKYEDSENEMRNNYGGSEESTAKIGDWSSEFYYNCEMTSDEDEDSIGDAKERFQHLNTSQDSPLITHSDNKNSSRRFRLSLQPENMQSSSSVSSSLFLLKPPDLEDVSDSSFCEARFRGPSLIASGLKMRGKSIIKQSEVVERVRKYVKGEWKCECNDVDIEL
jgi:hypothetical protein